MPLLPEVEGSVSDDAFPKRFEIGPPKSAIKCETHAEHCPIEKFRAQMKADCLFLSAEFEGMCECEPREDRLILAQDKYRTLRADLSSETET